MHGLRPPFDPGPEYAARKRKLGLCVCYRCTAKAGKHLSRCYRHTWQARKRRDPIGYIFDHRRQRAKERGHEWTITRENFRDWCEHFQYHKKTGRTVSAMSIDRKDPSQGYHIWNIRPLGYGMNSARGQKVGDVFYNARTGQYEAVEEIPF